MEYWLLCVMVSVVASGIGLLIWKHEFDFAEAGVTIAIATVVSAILIAVSVYRDYGDVQILNGQVLKKYSEKVSCRHSYSCNCHTSCSGTGKNRRCTQHCSTCYDHSYDIDWTVDTTFGAIDIDRVDRQGKSEPQRWTDAIVGEPAHVLGHYTNYIKGSPDSLFNKAILKSNIYNVPQYNSNIFDYYRYNRVVQVGVNLPEATDLNNALADVLRTLGSEKKVNIVPVFTNYDANFARALEAKWLGGKINDVVIVTGIKPDNTITFVKVFSWSKSSILNYELENAVKSLDKFDVKSYTDVVVDRIKKHYVQRSSSEFKYLDDAVKPSDWVVSLSLIICFFGSLFMGYLFSKN